MEGWVSRPSSSSSLSSKGSLSLLCTCWHTCESRYVFSRGLLENASHPFHPSAHTSDEITKLRRSTRAIYLRVSLNPFQGRTNFDSSMLLAPLYLPCSLRWLIYKKENFSFRFFLIENFIDYSLCSSIFIIIVKLARLDGELEHSGKTNK